MFGPKAAVERLTLLSLFAKVLGEDQLARLKFFVVFSVTPGKHHSLFLVHSFHCIFNKRPAISRHIT
jgi:hypothetical protein